MARFTHRLLLCTALAAFALAAGASAQDVARPVDTLQFGLLQLGSSQDDVESRLGPPAHVERDTRSVVVPVRARRRHDAPAYVVRTIEYEWWYYPEGGGAMATRLEFRNGALYAKDKYR
jgi:Protein of unknown function (DUF2845)